MAEPPELMELLMTRLTLQETFVKSLGCPLNDTTDSADKLRDAFEEVVNRILQLPPVVDKEKYRPAAEKAAQEEVFLSNLQSSASKQRREQAKIAFETAETQKIEEQARWEVNQSRMEEEKRLLGLEGGERVFNAFADASDDDEEFGFGVEIDEAGYGMANLLGGNIAAGSHGGAMGGSLTDAERERIFIAESERARQEAILNSAFDKAPTSAPTAFKVKAKDGKEGKMVQKMKAKNTSAIEEGTIAITKIDMSRNDGGAKAAGAARRQKAKDMEKQAKLDAKEQKKLEKAKAKEKKKMSVKVKSMQAKAMESNASSTYEAVDMTGVEIENKGAVGDVVKLAKAKANEARSSITVDRSQLQKVQARGPAEALQQILAASKEQESGTSYEKTVVEVKGLDSAAVVKASVEAHKREEEALREARQATVAEEAAALGLDKGERVFNAFADLDGFADGTLQENSLVAQDEHGYGMDALLQSGGAGHGGVIGGGANVDFMEESRLARQEALDSANASDYKAAITVAPSTFKVKAKDGKAGKLITKMAKQQEQAVEDLKDGPVETQKVVVKKSKMVLKAEAALAKQKTALEKKEKLDGAKEQKKLRKQQKKKKGSSIVEDMQASVQNDTLYSGPEKVEIETKVGAVAGVTAIAKAKVSATKWAGKIDRSKLQKVQARGPAEKLLEMRAAAAAQAKEVGGFEREVVSVEISEEQKAEKAARLAIMQEQARKASDEHAKMVEKLGDGGKHHVKNVGPTVKINAAAVQKINAHRAAVEAKYDDYFEKKIAMAKKLREQKEADDVATKEKATALKKKKAEEAKSAAEKEKADAASALKIKMAEAVAQEKQKRDAQEAYMEKMRSGGGDADSGVVDE